MLIFSIRCSTPLIGLIISKWRGLIPFIGCPSFIKPRDGTVDPVKELYEFGEYVTVFCLQGFTLIGSEKRMCLRSSLWSGQVPTCSAEISKGKLRLYGIVCVFKLDVSPNLFLSCGFLLLLLLFLLLSHNSFLLPHA